MTQLYKYHGQVSSMRFDGKGCGSADIVLGDINDWDKPPVRVKAHGALAKYLLDIGCTDVEEKYIFCDWFYDRNLFLHRVEVPSDNECLPAKVITNAKFLSEELVIFGSQEYIETSEPKQMDAEQRNAWCMFRYEY